MVRGKGRRRVAIYCRVSTGDQDNDRQERELKEYAERAGYEAVAVFRETLSGIRKAKCRQPVERKRAMAQAREIDAVLVTKLTRWGCSTQDLMDTLGQPASWDVSLIVVPHYLPRYGMAPEWGRGEAARAGLYRGGVRYHPHLPGRRTIPFSLLPAAQVPRIPLLQRLMNKGPKQSR